MPSCARILFTRSRRGGFTLQAAIGGAHHPGRCRKWSSRPAPSARPAQRCGRSRPGQGPVRFSDNAGSATGRGRQFNDLDAEASDNRHRRLIEFRRCTFGGTTGVEGKFQRHGSRRVVVCSVCATIAYFPPSVNSVEPADSGTRRKALVRWHVDLGYGSLDTVSL